MAEKRTGATVMGKSIIHWTLVYMYNEIKSPETALLQILSRTALLESKLRVEHETTHNQSINTGQYVDTCHA